MPNGDTIIKDVYSAKDAKSFVTSVDVNYKDNKLKDTIFVADNDSFLLITKKIGSKISIIDVKLVDDAFMNSMIS